MSRPPRSFTKYQREAIKMIEGIVGITPFSYERTNNNHLKILIEGVNKPLYTGSTPSDKKSIKNFKSEIKNAFKRAHHQESKTVLLQPADTKKINNAVFEKIITTMVKNLRLTLESTKKNELDIVMESQTLDSLAIFRKELINKQMNSAMKCKNKDLYFKKSSLKIMAAEFSKHIDFMLPTKSYYAEVLKNMDKETFKEVVSVEPVIATTPKARKLAKVAPPSPTKAIKNSSSPEVVFNVNSLMSLSHYDRVDHLKSLSSEMANQLIDDIKEAIISNKEDHIAEVIELMQSKGLSLSDLQQPWLSTQFLSDEAQASKKKYG